MTYVMYIVVDTHVFNRALGGISEYWDVLERIREQCNIIACSKEIIKEYLGRARSGGMEQLIVQRKIEDLKQIKKVKVFKKSKCDHVNLRKIPSHQPDEKFVRVAVASSARYIISKNKHLTDLNPYDFEDTHIEIIEPKEYLQKDC